MPTGDLLARRLAAVLLHEAARDAHELVDRLHHVDGDADRPRLVGDRARDRLADPPRRVGAELEALAVVELLDRADQADVAFLDQVEQRHAAADVLLRDADDEPQVRLGELLLGAEALALQRVEVVAQASPPRCSGRSRGPTAAAAGPSRCRSASRSPCTCSGCRMCVMIESRTIACSRFILLDVHVLGEPRSPARSPSRRRRSSRHCAFCDHVGDRRRLDADVLADELHALLRLVVLLDEGEEDLLPGGEAGASPRASASRCATMMLRFFHLAREALLVGAGEQVAPCRSRAGTSVPDRRCPPALRAGRLPSRPLRRSPPRSGSSAQRSVRRACRCDVVPRSPRRVSARRV